jgi:hypothetical protein
LLMEQTHATGDAVVEPDRAANRARTSLFDLLRLNTLIGGIIRGDRVSGRSPRAFLDMLHIRIRRFPDAPPPAMSAHLSHPGRPDKSLVCDRSSGRSKFVTRSEAHRLTRSSASRYRGSFGDLSPGSRLHRAHRSLLDGAVVHRGIRFGRTRIGERRRLHDLTE